MDAKSGTTLRPTQPATRCGAARAIYGRRRGSMKKATGHARGFIIGETPAECAASVTEPGYH